MKDVGIIGSSDGPTAIFVSSEDENFFKSGGIIQEDNDVEIKAEDTVSQNSDEKVMKEISEMSIDDRLSSKTLSENLNAGFKIMGIGMAAVFGVLTILYFVVKIMGQFAKQKKDKESDNEKN